MEFEKIDYERAKLKPEDKVGSSLIGKRLNQNSTSKVEISKKQIKKSVKVLSRLNEDKINVL